jgi:hypothetical protein
MQNVPVKQELACPEPRRRKVMDNTVRRSAIPSTTDSTSIGRILFLVTYMFLGSLLALSAASSAWAAGLV